MISLNWFDAMGKIYIMWPAHSADRIPIFQIYFYNQSMFMIYLLLTLPFVSSQTYSQNFVWDTVIELTCESEKDMNTTRKLASFYKGQTNIIIQCESWKGIDPRVWERLSSIHFEYVLFLNESYKFTSQDYTSISRFHASTIANLFPETLDEKTILRYGKPWKIYEPLIGWNIYSGEELDTCNSNFGNNAQKFRACLVDIGK